MIAKRSFVVETENSKALSEYLQQEAFVVANLTKISNTDNCIRTCIGNKPVSTCTKCRLS